jgi:hypothetical protein
MENCRPGLVFKFYKSHHIKSGWESTALSVDISEVQDTIPHLMILGLLACTLDLVLWTRFGESVVNAYIFTANNSSGNPLWSWLKPIMC